MADASSLDGLINQLDGTVPTEFYVHVPLRRTGPDSFVVGHTRYTSAMDDLWAAFVDCGFDPSSAPDYLAWEEQLGRNAEDVELIAGMSRADLFVLLTKCMRGERFCDGYQAGLVDSGILLAIARRLRELMLLDFT